MRKFGSFRTKVKPWITLSAEAKCEFYDEKMTVWMFCEKNPRKPWNHIECCSEFNKFFIWYGRIAKAFLGDGKIFKKRNQKCCIWLMFSFAWMQYFFFVYCNKQVFIKEVRSKTKSSVIPDAQMEAIKTSKHASLGILHNFLTFVQGRKVEKLCSMTKIKVVAAAKNICGCKNYLCVL